LKINDVVSLLISFKQTSRPEDNLEQYEEYVKASLEAIEEEIGKKLPENVKELYKTKARTIFMKYFREAVIYPPEVDLIVPYYLGTKRPMIQWKANYSEKKKRMLKEACELAGPVITCGFRILGNVMIDIDLKDRKTVDPVTGRRITLKEINSIIDLCDTYGLPFCITWHDGVHIFLPGGKELYPNGFLIRLVDESGKEVLLSHRAQNVLVSEDGTVKVEVHVDGVTPNPWQSWLWVELYDEESDVPTNVKFKRYVVPEVQLSDGTWSEFPYTKKWLRRGESLAKKDLPEVFRAVIEELKKIFNLKTSYKLIEVVVATEEEKKKAIDYSPTNFRGGRGGELIVVPNLDKAPFIYLFKPEVDFEKFMEIIKILDKHGLVPNCVKFFLLDPDMPVDNPHMVNIVAWYLLQHMKMWTIGEIKHGLGPWRKTLHGLDKVRVKYYVDYYSLYKFIVSGYKVTIYDVLQDFEDLQEYVKKYVKEEEDAVVLPRPIFTMQVAQAHRYMCAEEEICESCPFRNFCCRESMSSSRLLRDVVHLIASEIVYSLDPELASLQIYLDPRVIDRVKRGRVPPLPMFGYYRLPLGEQQLARKIVEDAKEQIMKIEEEIRKSLSAGEQA